MNPDIGGWAGFVWPMPNGVTLRRHSQIRLPAELCLIGDGASANRATEWGTAGARYFFSVDPDADLMSSARHNGGMNVVMVDGHGEWKPRRWVRSELDHYFAWDAPPLSRFFDLYAFYQ
jgi:prepilin-type processing-associated H-X9-DG protein